MKKACLIILAIVLIISIGFNIYMFNQGESMETSLANIKEQLEELNSDVTEKDAIIEEKDNQIAELEKTVTDLKKQIEELNTQISVLLEEKENIEKQIEEVKEKQAEQSSTAGGAGQTKQPENNSIVGPANEPNQVDPNEAAAKFGMTYGGSGLDTSGFDHGSGGAGWVLE